MYLEKSLEAREPIEGARTTRRRRSLLHQKPRREAECTLRLEAAELSSTLRGEGTRREEVAAMLSLSERTLAEWELRARAGTLEATPRGRPLRRSEGVERNLLIARIRDLGSHTGLEPLRALFPQMPRSEIEDLLARYRTLERKRHSLSLHRLEWTTPQAVWAMDHALPPAPVDGHHEAILAVRDLSTGEPLLWQPVLDMTAERTIRALELLFRERGVPLVLKHDNGSAFRAEALREILEARGVHQLFSPPRTPRYNGACEAGIRRLKAQSEHEAARHGRSGRWRSEDLERARAVRALLAGPPRPDPLPESVRERFAATVGEKELEVREEIEYSQLEGKRVLEATIMRRALSRALIEHGFLHIRRRRIPLPQSPVFLAKIS